MSVVGSLNINLAVVTGPLVKGLKQARGELAGFAKAVTSPVAGLAAIAGVGLSASAFTSFVGGAMEAVDKTGELSDRLGIGTKALSQFFHAASLGGVESEAFVGSLEKMNKTIGAAAMGESGATDALARLGLDGKELANAGAQESFLQIADAIKNIENPTERAAAAMSVFGKSGQSLLNVLTMGREGISEMAADADLLGISFDRVEAAKVEAANDALERMGKVFKGIANQIAIQLGPFIAELANRFVGTATSGRNMGDIVGKAFEMIAGGAAFFADVIGTIPLIFKRAQIAVTQGIQGLTQKLLDFSNAVTELTGIGSDINPEETFLFAFNAELENSVAGLQDDLNKALTAPSNGEKIKAFFEDLRKRSDEAAIAVAESAQQFGAFDDTFEKLKEQEEKAKKAKPKDLNTTGAATRGSAEAFSTINRSLTKPGEETAKNTKAILNEAKRQTDLLRKIDTNMSATTEVASIA
jgi:DNA-binding protein YbaB